MILSKIGRPAVVTPSRLQKLEWAFRIGSSDKEACYYAGICPQTLYNFQNQNPEFLELKEVWKSEPIFKARKTVVAALETDPHLAMKYLERKLPEEFGSKKPAEIPKPPTDFHQLVLDIEERNRRLREEDPDESEAYTGGKMMTLSERFPDNPAYNTYR